MRHELYLFWIAIWPNLAASIIWSAPVFLLALWHHRRQMRTELARLRQDLARPPVDHDRRDTEAQA